MAKRIAGILTLFLLIAVPVVKGENREKFLTVAPQYGWDHQLRLKSNVIPWAAAVPNLGVEYVIARKWSASVDVWFSPWKVSDKYSVKTAAILPEIRFWFKDSSKGSFINLHFNVAWFNVRANRYRYQDKGTPLLGAGIGYGYRVNIDRHWGFEFEIGGGVSRAKYNRYYNIPNGALKDSRSTTYWGLDRLSLTFSYNLCDL